MITIDEIFTKLDNLFAENAIDQVEPFLLSCLNQAQEEREYGIYISVGNELIGFYRSISQFEKAFAISEDVLLLLEELQLDETEHFATTLLNAATAYRAAGRYEDALTDYTRALKIYEAKLPADDYRFAGLYNNISLLLERLNENEKAAIFLERAISIVETQADARMELATSKTNLALIYFKLKENERAEALLEEAISIFQENGENTDAHYSAALAGMGEAYFHMGRLEKALAYYEMSLDEVEKHFGKNMSYALLCGNCASICQKLGEHEKAAHYAKQESDLRSQLEVNADGQNDSAGGAEDALSGEKQNA